MYHRLRSAAELLFALLTAVFLVADFEGAFGIDLPSRAWAFGSFCVFLILVWIDRSEKDQLIREFRDDRATLELIWEAKHPMDWLEQGERQWYRVGVKNLGPAMAQNVEVRLVEIVPEPWMENNILPSRLGEKGGYCTGNHCDINKTAEHYFDLFADASPRGMADQIWGLQTVEFTGVKVAFKQELAYRFELRVTAGNLADEPSPTYVRIRQKPEGGLDLAIRRAVVTD